MTSRRLTRVNELLKREIAEGLYRIMNDRGFDLAAVTVTRVITSSDLKNARVMVSIRGHHGERGAMLQMLEHHRRTIQQSINKHITLKFVPQLAFELDESIAQGDHVLSIIADLEAAQEATDVTNDKDPDENA
ncbi:MAG: 30S ribosome-binding factor RbfA [Kiritimatiellae bacterium]|nr:30S ribosome-binding factor RbfA [Kiritimatiellia bacterium]